MKKIIIGLLVFTFLGNGVGAKALAYSFDKKKEKVIELEKSSKSNLSLFFIFFKKANKSKNKGARVFKRLFYKKNKNTPPRKGDDLWILKLIYLVALLSILTFALSAIMLATGGMSSLWLTLMIVGGVIGVLPLIVIGSALLFQ